MNKSVVRILLVATLLTLVIFLFAANFATAQAPTAQTQDSLYWSRIFFDARAIVRTAPENVILMEIRLVEVDGWYKIKITVPIGKKPTIIITDRQDKLRHVVKTEAYALLDLIKERSRKGILEQEKGGRGRLTEGQLKVFSEMILAPNQ